MSKTEIIETLQDAVRRLRIEEVQGNDSVRDQIIKMTQDIFNVRKMSAIEAKQWASERTGFDD